jgi:hypothetical protein
MSATLNYNGMPPITQESNLDKWVLSKNEKTTVSDFTLLGYANEVTYVKTGGTSDDELSLPLSGLMATSSASSTQDTEGLTFYSDPASPISPGIPG